MNTAKGLQSEKERERAARAALLEEKLAACYPDAACSLAAGEDPFRLLVMARLSAQCTDARVNLVSEALFRRFPDAETMAKADVSELEGVIRSCGLYRSKAKNLRDMSQMLVERFDGKVPSEMDALLSLPGVGRKIANLVRGDCFGLGGIVADTHCIRIACRMGLADKADPAAVERALDPLIPKDRQSAFCHRMVLFGRDFCRAQHPRCEDCPLREALYTSCGGCSPPA